MACRSTFLTPDKLSGGQIKDYQAISKALLPENLIKAIEIQRDLAPAKRDLKQACVMAADAHDIPGMFRFGLGVAELHTLTNELIGESEVNALISLERFEDALELAYSAQITEMRIRLLARIYIDMQRKGRMISSEAISEIQQMVHQISSDMQPKELIQLAISIFPILPDIAIEIVEHGQRIEDNRDILDITIAFASMFSERQFEVDIVDRIQNVKLREMTIVNSPWFSHLSSEEVLQQVNAIERTKAKEYLLRQWCLQNKANPNLHHVLKTALDIIISDPNYSIPLRSLRQLADVLKYCNLESRMSIAKRFDIPNFTALHTPVQERLRLELSVIEAIWDISQTETYDRFVEIYSDVHNEELDYDVSCYCYIRILMTISAIDPSDDIGIRDEVKEKIQELFGRIIATSADQFEISRRILRALATTEPNMAVEFANCLNTRERRNMALQEVAASHVHQQRIPVDIELINTCLSNIQSSRYRDKTILRVVFEATSSHKSLSDHFRSFLVSLIKTVSDPIDKCECIAQMISTLENLNDINLKEDLFRDFLESWHRIDIVWQRVEVAFHQIKHIAIGDIQHAVDLYDKARILRDTSSLANQIIGSMFFQLLELATRLGRYLNLTDDNDNNTWNNLIELIEYIPSSLLRTLLFTRLAFGKYRIGDNGTFDKLMRIKVLPVLREAPDSDILDQVLQNITGALYEYDHHEIQQLLHDRSYEVRNRAWSMAALLTLANTNIGDPIGAETLLAKIDLQRANKVIEIIQFIEEDSALSTVISAFTRAIENSMSDLSEGQRFDLLNKIETIVKDKLPDLQNITHNGYLIVCESAIERARWKSTKRRKPNLRKKLPQQLKMIDSIENVADEALVRAWVAEDMFITNAGRPDDMLRRAMDSTLKIRNSLDRIQRLGVIADTYHKIGHNDDAKDIIDRTAGHPTVFRGS